MAKITDEVLGHADENDGIEEYDNPLPTWWIGLFLFTVVWGVWYGVNYHFVEETSQVARYHEEMSLAAERWKGSDTPVDLAYDETTLAAGQKIFEQQCVACHAEGGVGGGIGPSLVDAEWIHGGSPEEIRHTITHGVPEKGMVPWLGTLGANGVAQVAAYVVRLPRAEAAPADAAPAAAKPKPIDVDLGAMAEDERQAYLMELGQKVYETGEGGLACVTCHQANGKGVPGAFPPLVGQKDHMGDCVNHAGLIINGMTGPIEVDGVKYDSVMVPQGDMLDDVRIAAVISYVRNTWGNDYGFCVPEDVAKARQQ